MGRNFTVVFACLLLLGAFVPQVAAQAVIHIHPGWLNSTEGFDVAKGWPVDDNDCCWERDHATVGTCTFGVNNPDGSPYQISDFWNPTNAYPLSPSYLWIINGGAVLQSTCALEVTEAMPWLFVQFYVSDMNDGVAEIEVQEMGGSEWLAVGSYDTFGRGNNWVSIEGLPLGSYYVRMTSQPNGRTNVAPNGGCTTPAMSLQPARIGRTAPVPPEKIHITGGGKLTGGNASFDVDITFKGGKDRPTGTFSYVDHVRKAAIESTEIFGIEVVDDDVWLRLAGLSDVGTNHTIFAHMRQGGDGVGEVDINISDNWLNCTPGLPYQREHTVDKGQVKIK